MVSKVLREDAGGLSIFSGAKPTLHCLSCHPWIGADTLQTFFLCISPPELLCGDLFLIFLVSQFLVRSIFMHALLLSTEDGAIGQERPPGGKEGMRSGEDQRGQIRRGPEWADQEGTRVGRSGPGLKQEG